MAYPNLVDMPPTCMDKKPPITPMTLLTTLCHLPQTPRLFLACSGGRDSLSLAYACFLLHKQGKLATLPTLLHVHHGIQALNDHWAIHVQNWAEKHHFDCQILKVHLPKKNETHARDARYQALASVMQDGDILLLAHHSDDQAETVLMRLIAGSGIHGLSGIKTWQNKTIGDKTIVLHRPWLTVSRQDITNFAHQHALAYVDDPTNDTSENTRSFIRMQIMPKLLQLNPKANTNIARSAVHLSNIAHTLTTLTQNHLTFCQNPAKTALPYQSVLSIKKIHTLSPTHQSELLHTWLQGDEPLPPTQRIINDILALTLRHDPDHRTQILWQACNQNYLVCRYQDNLYRYWQSAFTTLTDGQFVGEVSTQSTNTILLKKHLHILNWQHPVLTNISIHPLTREQKLTIKDQHSKFLYGKKLYQTLKIAPWLRHNLWVVYQDSTPVLLIAPYQCWLLDSPFAHLYQQAQGASWQILHE